MYLENAKFHAMAEAARSGINSYVYRRHNGEHCITDTNAFWRDETEIGWFTPAGEWHDAVPDPEDVIDPSDKSQPTYDYDEDPANASLAICNQCDLQVDSDADSCPRCKTDNGLMDLSLADAKYQLDAADADGTDTGLGNDRWSVLRSFIGAYTTEKV